MKWALDSENMRVNADELDFVQVSTHSLRLPCCLAPVVYVRNSDNSRAYFRHPSRSTCPYAITTEYNLNLHWEIVDSLEELCLNTRKWHRFLWRTAKLPLWIRYRLSFHYDFQREVMLTYRRIIKRTDVKFGHYIFEIQCSHISEDEMKLREKVYRSHGLCTLWVMGIPMEKEIYTPIQFPFEAAKYLQKKFRKEVRLYRRFLFQSTRNSFEFRGIALEKWRVSLLQSHRIFAIYFRGQFYTQFQLFTMLTHIPKIQFEHACRKVDILHLSHFKEL